MIMQDRTAQDELWKKRIGVRGALVFLFIMITTNSNIFKVIKAADGHIVDFI